MPGPSSEHEKVAGPGRTRPAPHGRRQLPKRGWQRKPAPPDRSAFGEPIVVMPYIRPERKPPAYDHPRPRRRQPAPKLSQMQ